jgi:hypothetical protein
MREHIDSGDRFCPRGCRGAVLTKIQVVAFGKPVEDALHVCRQLAKATFSDGVNAQRADEQILLEQLLAELRRESSLRPQEQACELFEMIFGDRLSMRDSRGPLVVRQNVGDAVPIATNETLAIRPLRR